MACARTPAVPTDDVILLLLREGASTSLGDTMGRSPLLVAAESGNLAAVKALPLAEALKSRVRPSRVMRGRERSEGASVHSPPVPVRLPHPSASPPPL